MWPQISQAEGATPACFSTSSTGIYWDGVLAIWPFGKIEKYFSNVQTQHKNQYSGVRQPVSDMVVSSLFRLTNYSSM